MPEFELLLKEIRKDANDVKSFIFEKPENFSFIAGQFITLFLDVEDPRGSYRQFSVASSPTEDYVMITTTMRGSNFKNKLVDMLNQKVKVKGPFGRFTLQDAENNVMIAGGIGITPFRSMIKHATDTESSAKIKLIYSNKTPEDIIFVEDLDLMEKMNENLEIIHTITRPEGHFWKGVTGRVDEHMIEQHVEDMENPVFYVCGPPAMVDAMQTVLKEMGIAEERVKMERFGGY